MTAEEKAVQLFRRFWQIETSMGMQGVSKSEAIQCALIAVDEILEYSQKLGAQLYHEVGTESYTSRCKNADLAGYYKEVKTAIEKL